MWLIDPLGTVDDGADLITRHPFAYSHLSLSPSSPSDSIASHRFFPSPTSQLALIFTGIPSHLFSCLAALAQSKDRPFQPESLGTALRVLKEFFCRIHLAPLHQVTHGMFCYSVFLYHCFLVASLSTPPDFHLPFFNLHARKFLGVMCRTTLSKPRLTWAKWGQYNPSLSLWKIHPFTDSS